MFENEPQKRPYRDSFFLSPFLVFYLSVKERFLELFSSHEGKQLFSGEHRNNEEADNCF